jgi:hypothetical protein
MPIIQPGKERHTFQDAGSSIKFTVPSRKHWFAIFFQGFWITLWALMGTVFGIIFYKTIIELLFTQPLDNAISSGLAFGGIFGGFWLAVWMAGGIFVIYTFLWQLVGKEIVEISSESVKYQRAILGLGRVKEYLAIHIKDLRVSPSMTTYRMFAHLKATGPIAFDYGARTYRFGEGIDEAEAKQIIEKIVRRFPNLRAL